jgi:ferredoxin-like protein FixX
LAKEKEMKIYRTSKYYYKHSREIIIQDNQPFMVIDDVQKDCLVLCPYEIYTLDGEENKVVRASIYLDKYSRLPPVFICINAYLGKFVAKVQR